MDTQASNEETPTVPPAAPASEAVPPVVDVAPEPKPRNVRAEIADELLTRVLNTPIYEDANIMAFVRAAVARVQREVQA